MFEVFFLYQTTTTYGIMEILLFAEIYLVKHYFQCKVELGNSE